MKMRWLTRIAAAALFIHFLATSFWTGWTQSAADFPNYYTAAVAVKEGQPLRDFYDWAWFNREIIHAGIENQLGGYTPQTPLTMLPMIPLASLPYMVAKRVWLAINLGLLAATIYMLARVSGRPFEQIALLALLGHSSLASNFIYGQYYVFLLFLITLTFYLGSGFVSGLTFALKLYTGPLFLLFLAKRKWRSSIATLATIAVAGAVTIAMFGWSDIAFYLTHILPRALEGGSIDPYNPGVPTISTMLSHMFMREPMLNPNPLLDAPLLFFFSRTAVQLGLIVFATLGVAFAKTAEDYLDFAWFVILSLLLSTSTALYSFVLLLAPVALLLRDAPIWKTAYLAVSYILLNANLQPMWLFPKVWLLLLLFVTAGWEQLRCIPQRAGVIALLALLAVSWVDARRHMSAYADEPGRRFQQLPESSFPGADAIHPVVGAISPNGNWDVSTRETLTSQNLWIKDRTTGTAQMLAGGNCNSGSPVWEPDSSSVVFASDCGRAFGLTALYRAPVPH
jgi:hypothetical protein